MNTEPPSLLRTLDLTFQPASLLLIVPVALLLEFFGAGKPHLSLAAWLGTYVLCIWISRYAFALLDTAANGGREAPVTAVEMLGLVWVSAPLRAHRRAHGAGLVTRAARPGRDVPEWFRAARRPAVPAARGTAILAAQ